MTKYQKYTWVCTGDCDALIEYTIKDGYGWPAGVMDLTCRCNSNCTLLSVEDATIQPTETKGNEMETAETTVTTVPDTYNPNLLVTYKVIRGYSDAEYTTDKVTSIEWDLHNARQAQKRVGVFEDKVNTVKDIIGEAYASGLHLSKLAEQSKLICFLIMILIMNLNQRLQILSTPTHITAISKSLTKKYVTLGSHNVF